MTMAATGKKNEVANEVPKIPTSAELLRLAQENSEKEKSLKANPPKKR